MAERLQAWQARAVEHLIAAGEFERANKLLQELITGASTRMERAVLRDYARRKGLKAG